MKAISILLALVLLSSVAIANSIPDNIAIGAYYQTEQISGPNGSLNATYWNFEGEIPISKTAEIKGTFLTGNNYGLSQSGFKIGFRIELAQ